MDWLLKCYQLILGEHIWLYCSNVWITILSPCNWAILSYIRDSYKILCYLFQLCCDEHHIYFWSLPEWKKLLCLYNFKWCLLWYNLRLFDDNGSNVLWNHHHTFYCPNYPLENNWLVYRCQYELLFMRNLLSSMVRSLLYFFIWSIK